MLPFLPTRTLSGDILRGILRQNPHVDVVRLQDVGLSGQSDPEVLRWAAEQGRIVLTHDLASMPHYGEQRVAEGEPMPGIIAVRRNLPYSAVIEDLLLIEHCLEPAEINLQTRYLPLQ